ncbi:PAS/PAC sensor signal transduction histidine kinase [Paraburkholderia sp. BL6669N2]|uniref:trifunctional serine/threonine-protein kinase/ATP-binding protein/sensor histidine kinase n=1 Tax=Paraburkholderia sp. BL6669N2 TaxID=1938807 RepID=UPI000E252759|nr:ATP-binding sensor histidine kinase [Paraburkholderia sp. BL6669N2]REG57667.1 PAS/PAC sensor signal transduction histidine kinase [Paraburkholderia sp. BL6669N2]
MDLTGYELEPLHDDGDFSLYRARRPRHAVSVLALVVTRPASQSITRLEHEYGLAPLLDASWAARPLALYRRREPPMLVLDDDGGEPLYRLLGRPLELTRWLRIAVNLARVIGHVHRCGLVHKDIKPANVLVDGNGNVRLTGFGIASQLPHEHQPPAPPEIVAGTFAYMAPEQTGRMNRSIDTRSDLYSLGVTLYEMLTGALPFTASDAMEWIHCHIARRPTPPGERVDALPKPVEGIVLKLLAKAAEDRYQTAAGVEADLRSCLAAWEAHHRIEAFPLGAHDASDRLLVPEKLYGREAQIEALVTAFDRVVGSGAVELVLISGYPGIGKSSVVNELHRVLVPPRGLFASGKFDQYKRDIPYVPFAQAFQTLVRNLLSQSDAEVEPWRHALMEALGPNAQLMVNLIPELALIIGEQPPAPVLPPQDAQNRFQIVFRRFLGVFARPEHPLALFIDDLQWVDTATLDLLAHLVTHPDVKHVLLVGAYRDNEVDASHPFARTLESISHAEGRVQQIELAPLTAENVTQLVADSLHCDGATAGPLAQLVHEKTGGNPFFAIQFLTALDDEDLLTFDQRAAAWRWDLPRIRAKGFTENVADLMATKLSRLPAPTRDALGQLACLGNIAEVIALTWVQGGSEETMHANLWEAVRMGLVFRVANAYAFAHDRVQEAAYALIPADERAAAHLRIGRALVSRTPAEALEDAIFDIVNHLNRGAALIVTEPEREQAVALNLIAGRRAMNSTAYAAARSYLAQGVALLSPNAWTQRYDSTFDLYLAFSECEYLVGDFAKADALADMMLARARSNLDRAKVFSLRIELYQLAGRYDESFMVALVALRDFGILFPETDQDIQAALDHALREVHVNQAGRAIGELVEVPVATDPSIRAIVNLLLQAMNCAFAARPAFYPLITLKAVNLSLQHGNTENSSFAYGNYALMLVSLIGDIPTAVQFSEMSLKLNEKFGNRRLKGKLLHLYGAHVNFWRCHIAANLPVLERATAACLEAGDLVFAGNVAFNAVWQTIEKGAALEDVQTLAEKYAALARESHNDAVYELIRVERQFVISLRGKTTEPLNLNDETFDEAACFEAIIRSNFGCAIGVYRIIKVMLVFLDGRYAEALEAAGRAEAVLSSVMALAIEPTYHFFHALILTALFPQASPEQQQVYKHILAAKLRKLERWAEHCPENYQNRYALICAELARVEGRDLEAMRLYEEAVHSAHENGFPHHEGIANELAGRFYLGSGLRTNADAYLRNARHCFAFWGAEGKVAQLDAEFPRLANQDGSTATSTLSFDWRQFDAATLLKASQALSSEIELDGLIERLMTIALQTSGADRGLLVVPQQPDGYRIEAEARIDGHGIALNRPPLAHCSVPAAVLRYVMHTQKSVIIDDALTPNMFSQDSYLASGATRSLFCLPLVRQGTLSGLLYLENTATSHVFTARRSSLLDLLASQAAISLENTRLYADLQEREAKVRRLVDSNIIGIHIWDFEGNVVEANDAFLRIVDYSRDDLVSARIRWPDLTPPEWRDLDERVRAELTTTGSAKPFEKEYIRKDGSRVPVLVGAAAFGDREGQGVAFILDLTDQKRAQQDVRDSERRYVGLQMELAHSNRVATMGQLSASIAHEVKQPVTATIAYASAALRWLAARPPNLDEVREALKRIVADGGRANNIVDRTRAFFKKEPQRKDGLDINETILELIAFMRSEARKHGVELTVQLADGLPQIQGDRVQLQQVMLNLMINALEAMSATDIRERVLLIRSGRSGVDELCISVEDSGPGLDAEHLEGVFEAFFTTKPNGLGMGLPICRSIVESHGGRLWVTSNAAGGATFQFTLPAQGNVAHPGNA